MAIQTVEEALDDWKHPSGWQGPWPSPAGLALTIPYRLAVSWRNARWDAGRDVHALDRPVISIGNLSVGGTGKTPMVRWAIDVLVAAGKSPCIAMRGYRPRHAGEGPSDEAVEYAATRPGIPVIANPDRVAALTAYFASDDGRSTDSVVLDDGFQHRRLARDLDIVLIDATRSPFQDALLPAGWLRESPEAIRRAGAVVVTHAESASPRQIDAALAGVKRIAPSVTVGVCRHAWKALRVWHEGHESIHPVEWMHDHPCFAVCAIGNPAPFLGAIAEHGDLEAPCLVLGDHAPYLAPMAAKIFDDARMLGAACIVTTEKDWVKLRDHAPLLGGLRVARPVLELAFDRGEDDLRSLVRAAARRPEATQS